MELVECAAELGAIGATISGAGPTVLVWAFWQSGRSLLERLTEFAEGWADVRRAQSRRVAPGSRSRSASRELRIRRRGHLAE